MSKLIESKKSSTCDVKTKSFTVASEKLNKILTKEERKTDGIYFTPFETRKMLLDITLPYISDIYDTTDDINFLEPSCGSGEFIHDLHRIYPDYNITGVELNKKVFEKTKEEFEDEPNITLENIDFMEYENDEKFNVIIGNPPFCVNKEKYPDYDKKCMSGRGNLFVLILFKCLVDHLKPGGILSFILPTSFYNCSYYQKCRTYIHKNMTILNITNINSKFFDTKQEVMIFTVRSRGISPYDPLIEKTSKTIKKGVVGGNTSYVVKLSKDNIYFSPHYKRLIELTKGCDYLKNIGFTVKTGSIVWNQVKDKLSTDGTLLIYSSNIIDGVLKIDKDNELSEKKVKKQYINIKTKIPLNEPSILINRGYGNKYCFKYCLIDDIGEYFVENHINVITRNEDTKIALSDIINSFNDERTEEFIKLFVGNGSMSKTEIETILPIYLL